MNKYFVLTVKAGSIRIENGNSVAIKEVPENALDLLCNGCTWLILKEDAIEYLKEQPREKLDALMKLRMQQGYKSDVAIIKKALKTVKEPKIATTK